MSKLFTVQDDYQDSRFDRWFKQKVVNLPQSLLEKIIRQNKIKVNNKKIKSSYRVQAGDIVAVNDIKKFKSQTTNKPIKYTPKKKELSNYEDNIIDDNDNFIVINKPSGIPVQAGTKSFKNILDILKSSKYFKNSKPYVVHRLDKETSGILVIAKNRKFAQLFTSLFRIRKIHKTYIALAYGKVSKTIKILKDNLIYFDQNKKKVQKAITNIKILKSNERYSLLELNPVTGRKHQLRKQLLNIGNPIVGDSKYYISNQKKMNNLSLMLHAYKLKFMINNVKYNFKANYNKSFETFLKKIF